MIKDFKKKISRKTILSLLVGVLISILAYSLLLDKFFYFPPVNDTRDEVRFAFVGISLIKDGVPESWSWWDDYGDFPVVNLRGSEYRLVKPYFDDPPLLGLFFGGYAIWKGMDSFDKVDAGALRWPMLKLGALNVFLLFLLVYKLRGLLEASLASLVYATVPTIVLSSRLVAGENVLVTLSLTCLLLLIWYLKNNSKLLLCLIGLIAGSAILIKQMGLFIPASIIFLLISQKKTKAAVTILIFTLASILLYLGYGYYYDWDLFITLQGKFSGREIRRPFMIINLFDTFRIGEKMMSTDGWMIWGWISIALTAFLQKIHKKKLNRLIFPVTVGSYLILFAIMTGHLKGWYRFPLYPYLSWAVASVFIYFLKNPSFIYTVFFTAIAGFASYIAGTGEIAWGNMQAKIYQLIFPLMMAPSLFYELTQKPHFKKAAQIILLAVFALAIYFNIQTIRFFQDQFWY